VTLSSAKRSAPGPKSPGGLRLSRPAVLPRDGWRVAALPETASQIEETLALTLAAHHDARQGAVHQRSPEGFVAAAHFAVDDGRPQHPLGVVVRGRHLGIVEEHQPLAAMSPDVVIEAFQF
jgi:hypothetical protein